MSVSPAESTPAIRWSASSLRQLLRGCSAQFFFQRLLGLEPDRVSATMKLGSAVHAAHEVARTAQLEGRPVDRAEVLKAFESSWEEQCREDRLFFPKGKDAESLGEQGRGLVEVMLDNLGDEKVLAAEMPFEVTIDLPNGERRTLSGFLDAVLMDEDGRITVFELKTSSTTYRDFKLEDDIQAAAYAYAARQLYGADVCLVYGVLVKKKTPDFQLVDVFKDEADFARLASLIQMAEAMLDAGIAYPNPTWMCSGCGFRSACAEWGRSRRWLPMASEAA